MRNATFDGVGTRRPRPLGVWILTICAALFTGVLPLVVVLASPDLPSSALISAGLGLGIIVAAIGAWQGKDQARIALLVLVVLYYVLLAFSNYQLARSDFVDPEIRSRATTVGVRSLLWIPIYLWYFLRPKTRAWYRGR